MTASPLPAVRCPCKPSYCRWRRKKNSVQEQQHKLDPWTVSLSHPDGLAQMMSGKSEIHGSLHPSAPFMYQELEDKRVHRVLNSNDVFGGPHTFNVVWATAKLYEGEPKIVQAFLAALRTATKEVNDDPAGSAALWVKADKSKLTPAEAEKIIRDKDNTWTMTPQKVMVVADVHGAGRHGAGKGDKLERYVCRRYSRSARQLMADARHRPMTSALLEVKGVTLQYKTPRHLVTATYQIDFSVHQSDRYVILGPSGCGKTTVLKAVGGFMPPVEGSIRINGRAIRSPRT